MQTGLSGKCLPNLDEEQTPPTGRFDTLSAMLLPASLNSHFLLFAIF